MITVKEYAESRNKSVQAVYKQLQRDKNKKRLEGHLFKQDRTTYLDEEAIKILDESQNVAVVLADQKQKNELSEYKLKVEELTETNNKLRDEQDFLKNKIINLQDELKVKTEQMATMLVENKEKTLLLEQKKDQSNQIEELKKDKQVLQNEKEEQKQQIEELQQEKKELQEEMNQLKATNDQLSAKVASQSVSEGQNEPKKGFFARLFGK